MHDDVIDIWAWHCICNGIATPELARSLAQTTGHGYPKQQLQKYNYKYVGIACHNVSVCH